MLQHPHGHGLCAAWVYQRGVCHGQLIVLHIGRQVRRCALQDDCAVGVFAARDTDLARFCDCQGAEVDAALGELCASDGQAAHDCRGVEGHPVGARVKGVSVQFLGGFSRQVSVSGHCHSSNQRIERYLAAVLQLSVVGDHAAGLGRRRGNAYKLASTAIDHSAYGKCELLQGLSARLCGQTLVQGVAVSCQDRLCELCCGGVVDAPIER